MMNKQTVQWHNPSGVYTAEMIGSAQSGTCFHCGLEPTPEGHDGCLGTLPESIVMNACCGHGASHVAYVQFWDGSDVRGNEAVALIKRLKVSKK